MTKTQIKKIIEHISENADTCDCLYCDKQNYGTYLDGLREIIK